MPFTKDGAGKGMIPRGQADLGQEPHVPSGFGDALEAAPAMSQTPTEGAGRDAGSGQYRRPHESSGVPAPSIDPRPSLQDIIDRGAGPAVSGSVHSALLGPLQRSGAFVPASAYPQPVEDATEPAGHAEPVGSAPVSDRLGDDGPVASVYGPSAVYDRGDASSTPNGPSPDGGR